MFYMYPFVFIIKTTAFNQFRIDKVNTVFLKQRLFVGEQIRADTEAVAFDFYTDTRKNGGEHIKTCPLPIVHTLLRNMAYSRRGV